jgi:hypothetical protein
VATVTSLGTNAATGAAASIVMTVTASVSVGEFIVVGEGIFGSRATHTVVDSAGNTYTQRALANQRCGGFIAPCTSALTSGVSTITAAWGGGTDPARTIGAAKVTGSSICTFDVAATANGSTAAWNGGTTAATSAADELIVGICSCDSAAAATSTPAGVYNELFDVTNGGAFQLTMVYKIVAATGAQSAGGTWTSSGWAWNANTMTFQIDAAGGGGPTVKQLAALGVG